MAALNDTALLSSTARGDTAAFETLFQRHYDRVYGILFRLVGERGEAEDLAQEAFLRLHAHARRRRNSDDNVSAWLYRVATNLGYNALRDRRRRCCHRSCAQNSTGCWSCHTDDCPIR